MRRSTGCGVIVLLAVLALSGLDSLAEPVKIRLGVGQVPTMLHPLIFQNQALLKHYGKSYTVEVTRFRGGAEQLQPFAAKEIDLGYFSHTNFVSAIVKAKLDIVVTADISQDGREGWFSVPFAALQSSGIKTVKDLKGKRIGVNLLGTSTHDVVTAVLRKAGLVEGKDYTVIEVNFPNQGAMLQEGKIDVAALLEPFWYRLKRQVPLVPLFTFADGLGLNLPIFQVGRREFLKANEAAVVDFFEDYTRGLRWYLDPAHRGEALGRIAAFTKLPVKAFEEFLFLPGKERYRSPDAMPDLDALQRSVDIMYELRNLGKPFAVRDYADLSYVQRALARPK